MFHVEQSKLHMIDSCPICTKGSFDLFLKCADNTVTDEDFNIVSCTECGFKFTNPIPLESEIGKYYKSEEYVSHSRSKKGFINSVYHIVRKRAIKQKFKLVDSLAAEKNILDIGCGTGDFLAYCNSKNWKTLGLEPDDDAREFCVSSHGLEVRPIDELGKLPEASFDVITMWHVLEHVYHLRADIEKIKRALKKDGTLIVAVPNCSSKDAAIYKENWAAYDVPRHLYHFTPNDISNLFSQFDFRVEKILPMKFDAYYVSMLSEKYCGGNMVKGIIRGWKSNLAANANNHKYSSQIYVLKPNS
jgi:2-polyprenyl-3-methyl-5-hydroxy-6-metoxy-1,4-benzoquinol methylase